jgi:hypothetical protein
MGERIHRGIRSVKSDATCSFLADQDLDGNPMSFRGYVLRIGSARRNPSKDWSGKKRLLLSDYPCNLMRGGIRKALESLLGWPPYSGYPP